ncbi:hypothetical protein BK011_03145 [Tenericutes bacterium MZ-XQ]|nr:hypothetical protein BK011_03145 [Tenericutes bacterium MZ-XQ]
MKKYVLAMVVFMLLLSMTMTLVYGWFTYVQRKSISTFTSNDIDVIVYLNENLAVETMDLSNLAFVDFEDDILNDTNKALNNVAEVMHFEMILSGSSPVSKSLITLDIYDGSHPLIYLIMTDDTIVDYHSYLLTVINPLDTKTNILAQIDAHNDSQMNFLSSHIMLPGETQHFKVVIWGDYDALSEPKDIKNYQTTMAVQFRIVNAYGDVS